jgi:tyrosine-protein kinase Etk/Wzc
MEPQSKSGQVESQSAFSQDVHFLDMLTILSRRRRFVFFFTVGAAVLTTVAVLFIPSRYTAETIVLPPGQNSSTSSALLGALGGSGALASAAGASLGIKNPGDIYVSLLRSRTVEDAVIKRFGLMDRYRTRKNSDARVAFEKHSNVVLGAKDGLITIGMTDRDPKLAADIANGYLDEFRKFSAELAITEASQRRIFFQQQLFEANQNLAAAEEAMKGIEQSTGVLQIDSQTRALIESAADLRAQVVAKQVQMQGMRSYATEDNPQMLEVRQQLAALQAQLAKLGGSDQSSSAGLIVPKGNVPQAGMEYIRKLRDVKYSETIAELIGRQFEMAKLDEARQGMVIQVVDVALPPDHRSFPRRTITVAIVSLLGFLAACGWCFLVEGFERLKSNPAERLRLDALRATFQ